MADDNTLDETIASISAKAKRYTGRKMNTNGWAFWKYEGKGGSTCELSHARDEYLQSQG